MHEDGRPHFNDFICWLVCLCRSGVDQSKRPAQYTVVELGWLCTAISQFLLPVPGLWADLCDCLCLGCGGCDTFTQSGWFLGISPQASFQVPSVLQPTSVQLVSLPRLGFEGVGSPCLLYFALLINKDLDLSFKKKRKKSLYFSKSLTISATVRD